MTVRDRVRVRRWLAAVVGGAAATAAVAQPPLIPPPTEAPGVVPPAAVVPAPAVPPPVIPPPAEATPAGGAVPPSPVVPAIPAPPPADPKPTPPSAIAPIVPPPSDPKPLPVPAIVPPAADPTPVVPPPATDKTPPAGLPPIVLPPAAAPPAPKVELPKAEPSKVEPPKVEPPKVEPPKTDLPKVEPPKVEPPKLDLPKVDAPPKIELPKPDAPKVEPPKLELPKVDAAPPVVRPIELPKVEPAKPAPVAVPPMAAEPPAVKPIELPPVERVAPPPVKPVEPKPAPKPAPMPPAVPPAAEAMPARPDAASGVQPGARPVDATAAFHLALAEAKVAYSKVRDYSGHMIRQERVKGVMQPETVAEVRAKAKPNAVSVKTIAPASAAGREVTFVANTNGGRARLTPPGSYGMRSTISVEPTDPRAVADSKHPVTDTGVGAIVDRLERIATVEARLRNPLLVTSGEYAYAGRPCTRYDVYAERPHALRYAYHVVVYLDAATKLPVRFEAYDAPAAGGDPRGELAEVCSFVNLAFNQGLPDAVFER